MTRKILLNPWPATTTDNVKKALIVDDICPREKEFWDITKNVSLWLLDVINANSNNYSCVLFWWSWTLVMESVITSLKWENEEILIIENWAYGKRFKDIAKNFNIKYHSLEYKWWEKIIISDIEKKLKENSKIKYVYFIHMETTTWILNNLKEINKTIHKYNAISIVDAMSSFAWITINSEMDEIDYLISTSNKCIWWMAWIWFVIWKLNLISNLDKIKPLSYYSNLYLQYKYFKENYQFRFTPPVQIIYSLNEAVKEFQLEWWKNRENRFIKNYNLLKKWLKKLWFKFLLDDKLESKILITILEPNNFDFNFIHDELFKQWITIYPWKLNNDIKSFRLSILWDLYKTDIKYFLETLEKILNTNNIKITYD